MAEKGVQIVAHSNKIGVLSIGPIRTKGGVASVMRMLTGSELRNRFSLFAIHTSDYKEGTPFRQVFLFLNAVCQLVIRAPDIQVVHIHASSGRSFYRKFCFFLLAKLLRKKVIFHLHSGNLEFYYHDMGKVRLALISFVMRQADLIVVLAKSWKNILVKKFPKLSETKVKVIKNPVQIPPIQELKASESNGAKNSILFMGFLTRSKGVYDIVQAAPSIIEKNRNVEFVLCGMGPEESGLKKTVRDLKIEEYFVFSGWVEGTEKLDYLRRAKVFILPSYNEGMPISLLEAMSLGLPLVSTRVGSIPEIIQEGKNGFLIEPGDVSSLARNICLLLEDSGLREAIQRHNLETVRNFYPDQIAKSWSTIYQNLAK